MFGISADRAIKDCIGNILNDSRAIMGLESYKHILVIRGTHHWMAASFGRFKNLGLVGTMAGEARFYWNVMCICGKKTKHLSSNSLTGAGFSNERSKYNQ